MAKCWKAENQIDRLISQLSNLLSNKIVEINNDHRSVNYQVSEKFERRSGLGSGKPDEIENKDQKEFAPVETAPDVKVERGNH